MEDEEDKIHAKWELHLAYQHILCDLIVGSHKDDDSLRRERAKEWLENHNWDWSLLYDDYEGHPDSVLMMTFDLISTDDLIEYLREKISRAEIKKRLAKRMGRK